MRIARVRFSPGNRGLYGKLGEHVAKSGHIGTGNIHPVMQELARNRALLPLLTYLKIDEDYNVVLFAYIPRVREGRGGFETTRIPLPLRVSHPRCPGKGARGTRARRFLLLARRRR